jgi:tetratricopeptide (TPR) repeat protein
MFFVLLSLALSVSAGPRALDVKAARASELGSYQDARRFYVQELNLLRANGDHTGVGKVYMELGELAQVQGELSIAEANFKQGLAILSRYAGPQDMLRVTALDRLGWLYVSWGRFVDGSRLMEKARILADAAQPYHPALIRHLDMQAAYLMMAGRYSQAQRDWQRALEIGKHNFGPDSLEYDDILLHFGQGSAMFGDYTAAEKMLRSYLQIEAEISQVPSMSRAVAAAELARVYGKLHKYTEAENWFGIATVTLKRNPEQAPLGQALVASYLGDYAMERKDWSTAQTQYRQTLRLQQSVFGQNQAVAAAMISLSKALKKLHRNDEAKDLVARAEAIIEAGRNPFEDQTVDVVALRLQ